MGARTSPDTAIGNSDFERQVLHLMRLSLSGTTADVASMSRTILRAVAKRRPDLREDVRTLETLASTARTRSVAAASHVTLPTDADSRLALLRRDSMPDVDPEPTWSPSLRRSLESIVEEHRLVERLSSAGVSPTRSVLLVGPPGTGKSLAAKWLARELMMPLLTLDLSAVMSSFLGRTGNNIRVVLDYARVRPSVLLLDEFDALAKRRDDVSEIGELKRLVTVLLQEIDEWPEGLLIAATNHPDLLDPAIWRRFDQVLEFPLPSHDELIRLLTSHLAKDLVSNSTISLLAAEMRGQSFADAVRMLAAAQRAAVVRDVPLQEVLTDSVVVGIRDEPRQSRLRLALDLVAQGMSQREASRVSGVARDTIRKRLAGEGEQHGT